MGLDNALLIADVWHARHTPRKNAFSYKVYYLCFPLSAIGQKTPALFSFNKPNVFSFTEKDHGFGDHPTLEGWVRSVLNAWKIDEADGEIVLLTLPRVLGFLFNPVSFFFCFDKQKNLRAVVSEVNNTFNERHAYVSHRDDKQPIAKDDWMEAKKVFHVSPFLDVKGFYRFRFAYGEDNIGVWIDYYEGEGQKVLSTSVIGKRFPLSANRLFSCFVIYPWVTVKVLFLIHYQAVKLMIKKIRYFLKPPPPDTEVSR